MKYVGLVTLLGLFLMTVACEDHAVVSPITCEDDDVSPTSEKLVGTWQLYEVGWSPGSGYFVDQIPSVPAQMVAFCSDGTVSAIGERLGYFSSSRQYHIDRDSTKTWDRLVLDTPDSNQYIMNIHRSTLDSLILRPFCFEGCHYGFMRVRTTD